MRGEEKNTEEGEMAQKRWDEKKIGGKSREEGEKKKFNFREEGEICSKSREEGEIGLEKRKKGDLHPCSTPPPRYNVLPTHNPFCSVGIGNNESCLNQTLIHMLITCSVSTSFFN